MEETFHLTDPNTIEIVCNHEILQFSSKHSSAKTLFSPGNALDFLCPQLKHSPFAGLRRVGGLVLGFGVCS